MHKLLISLLLLPALAYLPANKKEHRSVQPNTTFTTTHFNILFAPDMSNRVNTGVYKRPLTDVDILSILNSNLYPTILKFKRVEYQKDKLTIDFINRGLISEYNVNTNKLFVDFGRFANQKERITYINEKDNSKPSLDKDLSEMTAEFSRMNALAIKQNFGADIWSYLDQGVDDKRVLLPEPPLQYGADVRINTYRNILILPTDGYIEAGIYGKGVDLSKNTIESFRKAFLRSGETDMAAFLEKNKQFQIKPVHNEYLKNLEILVMELYDRSLTKDGSATVHPTDMEIIKLCWTQWLKQSNVKRFELHPYANSKDEAEHTILNFMGIAKN